MSRPFPSKLSKAIRTSSARRRSFASCALLLLAGCSGEGEGEEPGGGRALEGRLEVVIVEGPNGGSRYFLVRDDPAADVVELAFERAPDSSSGTRIAVDGWREGERFVVSAFDLRGDPRASAGTTREALEAMAPDRERTIGFMMVDYGEGVNLEEAEIQRFMFGTTNPGPTLGIGPNDKSTLQYYAEASYGHLAVSGDVEGPLAWSGEAACNGSGGSQLATQLRGQVSAQYGHYIWYYGSVQSECEYGWGSLGTWNNPSRDVWLNGDLFDGAITHEIGHNLGYQHASSIRCSGTPLADDPMTCTTTEYGSTISLMGNLSNGHMMALEKWYAGWFEGCNAVRVRSSGTFNLLPIESACGGVQALQIPMPVTTRTFDTRQSQNPSPARYYYLEYRNGTGLDTGMTPSVMVVASDDISPPNRNCARSVQLDMDPSTMAFNGMVEGDTYEDPAGGLSFTVTNLSSGLATVSVTMSAAAMPNTCMDGATFSGSGPETCGDGGGTGGTGAGGASGGAGVGAGGASGGGGGIPAGAGGIPVAGNAGSSSAGVAGEAGALAGGAGGGTPGGASSGGSGGAAAGAAGTPGVGGTLGGSAGRGSGGAVSAGSGGAATAGGAGAAGTGGAAGSRPVAGNGGGSNPPVTPAAAADDAGCGCRVGGSSTPRTSMSLWSLAVLGLLVARRRRSAKRSPDDSSDRAG